MSISHGEAFASAPMDLDLDLDLDLDPRRCGPPRGPVQVHASPRKHMPGHGISLPTRIPVLPMLLLGSFLLAASPVQAAPPDEEVDTELAKAPAGPGAPADIPSPLEMLKVKSELLKRLLQQPKGKERSRRVKELADTLVIYEMLARRSLGDKQWSSLQEAQRKEFVGLLQALIEKNYIEQTENSPEFQVKWLEQEMGKMGDKARVVSLASGRGGEVELEYRVMLLPWGWVVYDLLVDGVSMTRNYYKTFQRIIGKDKWEGLIRRMKKKLAGAEDKELERGATEGRKKKGG